MATKPNPILESPDPRTQEQLLEALAERQEAWGGAVPTIVDFVEDPLFLGLALSPAQRTLLKAIYGLPLDPEELALWRRCTGRPHYPGKPFAEVTVVAGARAGKDSRIAAPIACYEAVFGGHAAFGTPGEPIVIPLVAQNERGTKIAFSYIKAYLLGSPLLVGMVAGKPLATEISLTNGITISCFPSTIGATRGWSIPVGVMDELAFFRLEEAAASDEEIQASIRRGMINFPTLTRLVKISTPYMKSGVLYEDFKRGFAQDDPDLLVWRASSLLMNTALLDERLERERRLDPIRFAREYEAEFAEDLEAFLPSAWVDEAVVTGRHELPPQDGIRYMAAVDPSGGGDDAMTLSIVHWEGARTDRKIVQDVMRGWVRRGAEALNLGGAVAEIAQTCKNYGLRVVCGDRYAAGWVRERFRAEGIRYEEATLRDPEDIDSVQYLDKSRAYLEVEPLFAQHRIELLDHAGMVRELKLLERRPRVGGRTVVDHPTGGHDDFANALALAAARANEGRPVPLGIAPKVPAHIAQIGEPARRGDGVGVYPGTPGLAPAAGRVGGQAAAVQRRYR